MPFIKACAKQEISENSLKKVILNSHPILIAKALNGQIYAFDAMCSHAEKSLEKGRWNPQTAEITCPFHKAIFAVAEHGAVKAPPAFVSLPVYQVEVLQENGQEFVYVKWDDPIL